MNGYEPGTCREGALSVSAGDALLWLLPERAVYLESGGGTLIVADVHLGKAEAFHRRGIAVPGETGRQDLARLVRLAEDLKPDELVILGDLLHAGSASRADVEGLLRSVRPALPSVMTLVRGNHDRGNVDWLTEIGLSVSSVPVERAGLTLIHEISGPKTGKFGESGGRSSIHTLCGHVHPVVVFGDRGDRLRLPCFHLVAGVLTVPAFGSFTGGYRVTDGEAIYAIGADEVFRV